MKLADRLGRVGESATMRVTRRVGELRAQGVDVLGFGAGEPDFPSPPAAVEAARRALADGFTRYTPAAGITDLRQALLDDFQRRWDAPWRELAEVVITVGAKAALFELDLALVSPGDEVVIPTPCWVTFPEQVRLAGGEPVLVPGHAADGYALRAETLLEALTPRTRAVVLNSPCNPTGAVLAADELETLVEVCAERGVVVVSDETYERIVYASSGFVSAASLASRYPETVVVVGSFSKTYAMTGWRLGYVLGPEPLLAGVAAVQSHATSNPTSFAMVGALAALHEAEAEVGEMVAEFRARRDLVVAGLDAIPGFECPSPDGAFYVFPRVSDCYLPGEGSIDFAEFLLEEARVAVVPGLAFGHDDHIRLSFTSPRDVLEEGLDRVRRALARRDATSLEPSCAV